jgi:Ser/Thr protein kinase RdoA (MazF antagonist)
LEIIIIIEKKDMKREKIVDLCNNKVLEKAAKIFGTYKDNLRVFADYEGAANLVYEYDAFGKTLILRLSFTSERSVNQILAELHFIEYLSERGVRVSIPMRSQNGNLIEVIQADGIDFRIVSFTKGKGMRVPDNGYQYRENAPIEEYFQNWGQVLGQMHRFTKNYQFLNEQVKRPGWFELHENRFSVLDRLPDRFVFVGNRIQSTLEVLKSLPKDQDSYGLIHGDFNDGNFTVDYLNGDITVFDFDDSCYFWFIYEIASAWEGGIGRVMYRGLKERKSFMERYMDQVLEGYNRENVLSAEWMERLPLFLKLIQIEEFLHYAQYIDTPDKEIQAGLKYKIKCITEEIPFMGFFDSIYSPEKPFTL